MYDCAYPADSNNSYDWYITDSNTIFIPGRCLCFPSEEDYDKCTTNGGIRYVGNIYNIINQKEYSNRSVHTMSENNKETLTILSGETFEITDGTHNCKVVDGNIISSDFEEDIHTSFSSNELTEGGDNSEEYMFLPNASKYTITSDDAMAFKLETGDYLSTVITDVGGTITFGEKGSVDVNTGTETDIIVSMTNNVNEGVEKSPTETILCENATNVSTTLDRDGIVVKSDNMDKVRVDGTDYKETLTSNFSSDANVIKITDTGTDVGGIVISKDSDNNGSFDQVIATAVSGSHSHTHIWNSGKITKVATCTTKGIKTYTCIDTNCGVTKTEEIPATGHKWNSV